MILIKGIELPKEPDEMIELAIFGDGKTLKTGESWRSPVDGKCYYGPSEDMNTYSALTVPSHGRLIDADALLMRINHEVMEAYMDGACYGAHPSQEYLYLLGEIIDDAPTIIPANEEDDDG